MSRRHNYFNEISIFVDHISGSIIAVVLRDNDLALMKIISCRQCTFNCISNR